MSSLMSKGTTTAATTDDQTSVEMKKRQQEDLEYARWFANLKKQVEGSQTKNSQEEEEEEDERLVVDDRPPPVCCPICQKPLGQYYNAEEDKLRVWCRAGCWLPWTQDCEDTAKMLLFASVGLLDTFKTQCQRPPALPRTRPDLSIGLVPLQARSGSRQGRVGSQFQNQKNIASALFLDLWATTAQKRRVPMRLCQIGRCQRTQGQVVGAKLPASRDSRATNETGQRTNFFQQILSSREQISRTLSSARGQETRRSQTQGGRRGKRQLKNKITKSSILVSIVTKGSLPFFFSAWA